MAGRQQGQVVTRTWKAGYGYALRFIAYGERRYLTLGLESEGWTRKRAEDELHNVLADVRRGLWTPPARPASRDQPAEPNQEEPMPTFGVFAAGLAAARKAEVSDATYEFWEWTYSHLLPFFGHRPLSEIDIECVDAYRAHKLRESEHRQRAIERSQPLTDHNGRVLRPLSPSSINKSIDTLQAVLAVAVEYGHIATNPATGRRRRVKLPPRRPVHLDTVEQIEAMLDAASQLDRDPGWRTSDRRPIIATLMFAGPRADELCRLVWRDVDLANARIQVGRSKTQAGLRTIEMLPVLHQELAAHKARSYRTGPDDPVFPTNTGGRRDKDNLRNRIVAATVGRADQILIQRGHAPLPTGVTPHKLRHTFASILVACGEDPATVMAQLGHTDPKFTLRIYTHLMRLNPTQRQRLNRLVNGAILDNDASVPAPQAA